MIMDNRVKFEKVEEYKRRSYREFIIIKEALGTIEEIYNIEVSDDEIAYILKIIYS
ncbi:MAG: PRD domain-containing protein [Tissierellia bacterium]|nr:PRD domain-containing protein [Tissierellia bacterium]